MKHTIVTLAWAVGCSTGALAQNDDPVVMRVNGKDIVRSEFEYAYNKNNSEGVIDKKTIKEYVPLYSDFKLKVAEAERQRIDTLTSIRKELASYKEQMVIPTIVDSAFIEREARRTYDETAARFAGEDLLNASHILVLLRQDATPQQLADGKARIDSIYNVLKAVPKGELKAKFAELASKHSDDPGSAAQGGALGQFGRGMMIPDFENAAFALKAGEMSAPVKSTVGYHIIFMNDRHPFESYEYHHDNIISFLEGRGIKEESANAYIDSIASRRGVDRYEVIDQLHNDIVAKDFDLKYLAQEYYDGTLMYEVTKKDVWDKAQSDEAGKASYFAKHKNDYSWDAPRFAGIVIYAKDEATMKRAKRVLKGVKNEADYATAVVKALNNDSVRVVRVERGIFKQGDNAVVDNKVFKQLKKVEPKKDYPVADIYGKKAKKPRTYKDVAGAVTTDYQNYMEKQWVESLKKRFAVEIFDDVIETVNKH